MREIKFRAWDGEDMIYPTDKGGWCTTGGGMISFFMKDNMSAFREIMQFTCLKDKNGKEIYEGDVVDFTIVFSDRHPDNNIERHRLVVKYEDGTFWPRPHTQVIDEIKRATTFRDFEVLGNIYENPDLLTV